MAERGQGNFRQLRVEDIPAALELSAEAGWNQTAEDWRTLLELAPATCLAIDVDGELASTTTLLCYGSQLAWVGMVLTKMKFRGRGFAKRLLLKALNLADEMKIDTVKLDATNQGKPLYEKSGFRSEQPVERWSRTGPGSTIAQSGPPNILSDELLLGDMDIFGADRSPLLMRLSQKNSALIHSKSWLLARSGSKTAYLGPCVSDSAHVARTLIERFIHDTRATISWDLLKQNEDAVAIAKDLGFAPQRYLTRMVRGKDLRGKEESVYALAGFEFG
jgi:predicted GNAT family acetyltransferase